MERARPLAGLGLLVLTIALGASGPAAASGGGEPAPWYLDPYGGNAAAQDAFFNGRVGVVMTRTSRQRLFMAWRLLHGLPVGNDAGHALSEPCCLAPSWEPIDKAEFDARAEWIDARKLVAPGTAPATVQALPTEHPSDDLTSTPVCFSDAFRMATRTLKDHASRFGAASPAVKAWLAGQDAVFQACGDADAQTPPLPADASRWLRQDRAYQEAALDLYAGRSAQAASRFSAIGKDTDSPWRPWAAYLQARALTREARTKPSPEALANARRAIDALAREPGDVPGKGDARDLIHVLAFRYEPAKRLVELDADLQGPVLPKDTAVLFRDYSDLIDQQSGHTEFGDWLRTLKARPEDSAANNGHIPAAIRSALQQAARPAALAHARDRWSATGDLAWLLAAMTLADPGTPDAKALIKDSAKIRSGQPSWLTIQYHLARLSVAGGNELRSRQRLDAVLARKDLSVNDRNLFRGLRLQVASDPHDFVRWALRRRLCADTDLCARDRWEEADDQSGDFDQNGGHGTVGLGMDAQAVIDRLPLAERIALSKDTGLPALIRMDIALTSFARAVQLQDDAALDSLANELEPLLPQMAEDFRRISATKPGPDKRFAVDMVMAKIPGLRVDLIDYVRPSGRVVDFQRHWMDWLVLPAGKGQAGARPPTLAAYQEQGVMPDGYSWQTRTDHANDPSMDMACLGECGPGAQPLRLPAFARRLQPKAQAERAFFVQRADTEEQVYNPKTRKLEPVPPGPANGRALWDEMLDYAKAHPNDPRIPEALHWIVHASHFGASHDQSGRRAFRMLQLGYPKSVWAARTRSYSE